MALGITEVMHQSIPAANINKCRREKPTKRKNYQTFDSAMYSSYQAGVSPEGGLEVGQIL